MTSACEELSCRQLVVEYGAYRAVDEVDITFAAGTVTALIGPNGAGKTTLMNAMSGLCNPKSGDIALNGRSILGLASHALARVGLGRSFQITQLFNEMSVLENLRVAAQAALSLRQPFWAPISSWPRFNERAEEVLEVIGMQSQSTRLAGTLSHGEQRALEIGVALVSRPRVLLLDEPLAGVGQHDVASATERIAGMIQGLTVVLVEHNMRAVRELAARVVVMAQGRVIADGDPDSVATDPSVRAAYLGHEGVL